MAGSRRLHSSRPISLTGATRQDLQALDPVLPVSRKLSGAMSEPTTVTVRWTLHSVDSRTYGTGALRSCVQSSILRHETNASIDGPPPYHT